MSGVRWKVCGITNVADAAAAVAAGADAIGFVFWPGSPRAVTIDAAASIAEEIPEEVWKVGVFVDPSPEVLSETDAGVGLDFVQLAGDETAASCAAAPKPVWKVLRLAPGTTPGVAQAWAERYAGCTLVVDAGVPGEYGGTGQAADWQAAAVLASHRRVVLAGGLRADNVGAAIEQVRPWAVDVSSGVEAEPGAKDESELKAFARALERYR
jgi:phosphoribosylanthranilate isomerase